VNRIKAILIASFAAYWLVVAVLLVAARPVVDHLLDQQIGVAGDHLPAEITSFLALTGLLLLLSVGVIRGWRWLFWLILVAYLAGILRVPAALLELAQKVPAQGPAWYVGLTAIVGLLQFCIALAMLVSYRRAGTWGEGRNSS